MHSSPFKMLDSYNKNDYEYFFGRDKETAQLYNAVFASNLTLLYGGSGTGKTSLVDCGLRNSFYDSDWLPLFIRRGNDLNRSLRRGLLHARKAPHATEAEITSSEKSIRREVQTLYRDYYRPVYLIFDQFEELFISGNKAEQEQFYKTIADLLESDLQAKVLLVFREEWIAYLNEFEKVVPNLLDNRLRIERMTDHQLFEVVEGTVEYAKIELEQTEQTIGAILDNLRDKSRNVELANLQIYLDKLYHNDLERIKQLHTKRPVQFDPPLVADTKQIEDVLSDFLEEQLYEMEQDLRREQNIKEEGIPMEILYALVTDDGTKRSLSAEELKKELLKTEENRAGLNSEVIDYCINRFNQLRIIRILSED